MYIFFGFLTILILILTIVSHAPLFKIRNNIKEKIVKNGLIHFTSQDNYIKIKENGLVGKKADMGFPETLLGELVWTYQYVSNDDMETKHDIVISKVRGKLDSDRYGICIRITGFCESDLNKLYTRRGFIRDNAIVYRGKVLNFNKVEVIKEWK
ncbi:hypothetical protein [Clostridium sp. Marseille-P2415]|uniref:hypothetical protein n=1 Tax=Clostridium sp. Marseille-P2415 TaxID=1805471 RepID=UPI000988943B|nr:hypothetical protein [Clostridium sp. Marseille-P2415]